MKNVKTVAYPVNFIEDLRAAGAKIKTTMPDDIVGTIEYVLATQSLLVADILRMRYRDMATLEAIGTKYGFCAEDMRKKINKAVEAIAKNKCAVRLLNRGVNSAIRPMDRIRRTVAMKSVATALNARNRSLRELGLDLRFVAKLESMGFYDTKAVRECGRIGLEKLGVEPREFAQLLSAFSRRGIAYEELLNFRADTDSVTSLNMSTRATNALLRSGVKTIEQLADTSIEFLAGIKGVGKQTATEIINRMSDLGRPIKGVYTVATAFDVAYRKYGKPRN